MPPKEYYLPKRALVNNNHAELIEKANVPRSKFTGSFTRKTTFNANDLVPFLVDEILPGDHMTYEISAYVRMATPLFPLFDNQKIETFLFYVPNRILWDNWVKFMGQQESPGDSIAYTVPYLEPAGTNITPGSIWDQMGIPNNNLAAGLLRINVLPFRAYNRIWNDWFRDQNIQNSATVYKGDTGDILAAYAIQRRAKTHDYFTSALPWPQKFTAPAVPLTADLPVRGIGYANGVGYGPKNFLTTNFPAGVSFGKYASDNAGLGANSELAIELSAGLAPQVFAVASGTGIAINAFRQAMMVQALLERDARGGTRYTELIRTHFGVVNPDFRLQRPEYIGGGSTPLMTTPIAQTAPTAGAVLGTLGGASTAAGQHRASYAATEHGFVIGLINVNSEVSYQQGIHKMYRRSTRYDYYWPALAQLGEQAIKLEEIYAQSEASTFNDIIFGYQERWHEYRVRYSDVAGMFRSTFPSPIDGWHLAEQFSSAPTLSDAFIHQNAPMSRVLAAGALADKQQYLASIEIRRTAVRPLPTFGTPATLGRF